MVDSPGKANVYFQPGKNRFLTVGVNGAVDMFCNYTWVGKAEVQYLLSLLGIQQGGIGKQSNELMLLLSKLLEPMNVCCFHSKKLNMLS
jgi:hypothetical protein